MIENKKFVIWVSIILIVLVYCRLGQRNYDLLNSPDRILIELKKDENNKFSQIKSNIDMTKVDEKYKNDPIKLIYDPKLMWVGRILTNAYDITVFFEFNPLSEKCEMTARMGGMFSYLDYLSKDNHPLDINIKSYTVKDDYCNLIYGYKKL